MADFKQLKKQLSWVSVWSAQTGITHCYDSCLPVATQSQVTWDTFLLQARVSF